MKQYVLIWVEADDDLDAEQVEHDAVEALERLLPGRDVQNRIQYQQP